MVKKEQNNSSYPSGNDQAKIKAFMNALSPERKVALEALHKVISANLSKGFEGGMQYGTPAWYVPHSMYPDGYHCNPKQPLPFAGISSTKGHIGLNFFCLYTDPSAKVVFEMEWKKAGKKWDAGKGCVRAKKLEDIPLKVVGKFIKGMTVKKFVQSYETTCGTSAKKKEPSAAKKTPTKTTPTKKTPTKKTSKKTPTKATPTKRTPTKKTPSRKQPTKSTPTKKPTGVRTKVTATKKTPTKKPPSKTTPTKKTSSKKTPTKKTPTKKTPSKIRPTKSAPTKKPTGVRTKVTAAKKKAPSKKKAAVVVAKAKPKTTPKRKPTSRR